MKVLCNLTTKKIEGFSRWDDIPFDPATHIVLDVASEPDMENQSLNDTNDGLADVPPPLTPEEKIKAIEEALQAELDKEAQTLGYDNIVTVVSYADEPAVPQFQSDGQSFRAWRSKVWAYAYQTQEQYKADVVQFVMDVAAYDKALAQYKLDLAKYEKDLAAYNLDNTLPQPTAPVEPTKPVEPVEPTPESMVAGMPKRV